MLKKLILFIILCVPFFVKAQVDVHDASSEYEYPADPLVREKLDKWQDLKFGVILHWGLYSAKAMNESWPLVNELWKRRDTTITYEEYKKWYWDQSKSFNPVKFNPEKWAEISKNAGMKYLVFTTKHHEGYSMFDTKQSDFKITNGPFANNPKADVTKYIFDAYRKQGMMIGAYFSKPDWHSEYFWWPRFATVNRNVNYNTTEFPKQWQKFKDFTYNQIGEILGNYGKVDILWLDGGWIRNPQPGEMEKAYVQSSKSYYPPYPQEVDIPRIAKMAREKQPGILVVDRTVH
jgi:alpha-L-fucosidase